MDDNDFKKAWGRVIAKAWQDEKFAEQVHNDPGAALKAMGAELPERLKIRVVDAAPSELVLVIPSPPDEELEERLDAALDGKGDFHPLLCNCVRDICYSW